MKEKVNKEKLGRLLSLYLEGNIPQASDVVKSSELEAEAERLSQMKSNLHRQQGDFRKAILARDDWRRFECGRETTRLLFRSNHE